MNLPSVASATRPAPFPALALALALTLLLAAVFAAQPAFAEARSGEAVGEVSLLLGSAHAESQHRGERALSVGSPVHASDQIVTGRNGHVHIRFIDDALVSVRPDSRLEITEYVYNASRPERSVVKFRLHEGVTRSISGDAGQSARDRFRLDTPIAAIGVRGTDFVVSANQDNVRALVNEGTIVVAPYSDVCISGGLGPCAVGGVELAEASMQILELSQGQMQPVLRPRPEQELHELIDSELEERSNEREETAVAKDATVSEVYQESLAIQEVSRGAGSRDGATVAGLDADQLRDRQLAWGRFAGQPRDGQQMVLAYDAARAERAVTVGNGEYGLFRREPDGNKALEAGLGAVGFELATAEAFHHGADGISTMAVRDGSLQIDFNRSRFATTLDLDSEITGRMRFEASGAMTSTNGYFFDRNDERNILGAVSVDGREAGYQFDQRVPTGLVEGLTLWGASE